MKGRYVKLDSAKMRWHRDRLGWTLDTLAEQAEVAEGTALRAEHGEDIRPSSGRRIARALGVDISELVPDRPGGVLPKASAPSMSGQPEGKESRAATHLSSSGEATPDPVTVDRNKLVALLRDRAGMSDEEEIDETIRRLKVAA